MPGPLLFFVYINDIYRSTNLGKFILFVDDTNIFVADKCKTTVYETANSVLNLIYKYMKCNLLHINYKKCCFMHFSPNRNDKVHIEGTMLLTLNGLVIRETNIRETNILFSYRLQQYKIKYYNKQKFL